MRRLKKCLIKEDSGDQTLSSFDKSTEIAPQFVLGTAQLGMPYGIANRSGQPDLHAAEEIIKTAWDNSIREFDTAQAYGESETVLGYCLHQLGIVEQAHIITKFSPDLDHLDRKRLSDSLKLSLDRLSCPKLGCIMLHKEAHLDLWNQGLGEILNENQKFWVKDHLIEETIEEINKLGDTV